MSDLIFGYTLEAINRAQQGGRLQDAIDTSKPISPGMFSDADNALIAEYKTPEALADAGFLGIADRLRRIKLTGQS